MYSTYSKTNSYTHLLGYIIGLNQCFMIDDVLVIRFGSALDTKHPTSHVHHIRSPDVYINAARVLIYKQ